MRWIDVAGPPGSGKSTICDPLWPHDAIEPKEVEPPIEWHDFLNEVTRLMGVVRPHPTFVAAVRMNRRTMRKMAAVWADEREGPYIQTGFIQRGLGFGWRMLDLGIDPEKELQHFFRLMPEPLGAVFLRGDSAIIAQRNRDREKVAATAHENREHMVEKIKACEGLVNDWLSDRDIYIQNIWTDATSPEEARVIVTKLAVECDKAVSDLYQPHLSSGMTTSKPVWW